MKYEKEVIIKDGRKCLIRSAAEEDAQAVISHMEKVCEETDFLMAYPGERSISEEEEKQYLLTMEESSSEIQLCAVIDGRLIGLAAVHLVIAREKTRHRADFSISIEKAFWNLSAGRELTRACIECAKKAGYRQLELEVVADNSNALKLYQSVGFTEYGRNPRGFLSRYTGWQELVLMRLELDQNSL